MHLVSTVPIVLKNLSRFSRRFVGGNYRGASVSISGLGCKKRYLSFTNGVLKISPIKTPNFPESITEGDVRWSKKVGDQVKVDDVIGEIETDKTSLPVVSTCNGVIKDLLFADGTKVSKGQILCNVDESEISTSVVQEIPKQTITVQPSENKKEVVQVQPEKPKAKLVDAAPKSVTVPSSKEERVESRIPMTRMRLTIANRLKEAQNTTAMLTTFNEIDMSTAIEVRNRYKDRVLKEFGVRLGFMSTFINASVYALKKMPVVNSVIVDKEIIHRNYVDISVAVSSPKGLVVPVIRNAHLMDAIQMEKAVYELAEKARLNQLAIEDMEGGTFTITNGGVFGSLFSTPIINMPQSSILGMHSIKDRPVAVNGKVEIRPMMYVALTYDHRLIDGREAVAFLKKIKDCVEDPSMILMGL